MCFRILTLLKGLHPKRKCFGLKSTQSGLKTQVLKTLMMKSPLEALVVLRTNVRIRMLKFEFWILALGYTHMFLSKFSFVKNLVSCLSVYLHDPKFYKMDIMFRSCIYTPTSMLLKFVFKTQNYFTKFSKFKSC